CPSRSSPTRCVDQRYTNTVRGEQRQLHNSRCSVDQRILRCYRAESKRRRAPVAELVDAADLKSAVPKGACRFESGPGHHGIDGESQPKKIETCCRFPVAGCQRAAITHATGNWQLAT